jgi:hypothetical protein
MTFTYDGDPSESALEEVRFYLQDVNPDDPLMSDEEIDFLIDTWYPKNESYVYVASVAAETIAAKFSREVSYSADGVSVSGEQLQQKYNDLAASLRDLYKSTSDGGIPSSGGSLYDDEFDTTVKPLNFSIGMNDNRLAGQQAGSDTQEARPELEGYPW